MAPFTNQNCDVSACVSACVQICKKNRLEKLHSHIGNNEMKKKYKDEYRIPLAD